MQEKALEMGELREPPNSAFRRGGASPELRPRVLVIDDELLLGQTLQLGLEDSMEVVLEISGRDGIARLIKDTAFDLILCDLSLPDGLGSEVYAELKAREPALAERFVIMTGGAMTDSARLFLDTHPGIILHKPFSLTEIEDLARRVLRKE